MSRRNTWPNVINFEGLGPCYYEVVRMRCPNRGEYYLSGAVVAAYKARQHLTTEYYVVRPTYKAAQVARWEKMEKVDV